jgi:hypothetical protein
MIISKLKLFYSKLDLPTDKLFKYGVIASLGAPIALFCIWLSFGTSSFQNIEIQNVASFFAMLWAISLFSTIILITGVYLVMKFRSLATVNTGLASIACILGFCVFAVGMLGSFESALPVVYIAIANALIFMFLAYRQSKK